MRRRLARFAHWARTVLVGTSLWSVSLAAQGAAGVPASPEEQIARIVGKQPNPKTAADSLTLQELMQKFHVPAVSIAVIKDFRIHWTRAYGVADVQTGAPADLNTMFQAASISKPLTAMAAMHLQQQGKLSIDEDVNKLLKSWRVPPVKTSDGTILERGDNPVTPRALFSHTSGSDDGFGFPGYHPGVTLPTLQQVLNGEPPVNTKRAVTFSRMPFVSMRYSGGGTTIMQLALMEVTGRPFAEIMRENVLDPLGMTNSTYEQPLPQAREKQAARAHDNKGERMGPPWHLYPEQSAAGLWTTPSDLARVVIEVQRVLRGEEGAVLTRASAREMITPVGVGSFAVGFSIQQKGEGWYFNHGGYNWGFQSDLLGHLRKGYGVVVMTNSENGFPLIQEIEKRVARAYGWDFDPEAPRR
jgi:CubicO group peptidase (beta-lactamase class C family)